MNKIKVKVLITQQHTLKSINKTTITRRTTTTNNGSKLTSGAKKQ